MQRERRITIKIPAGIASGQRLRLQREGQAGAGGGPAGDLYVVVHVEDHPYFRRDGDDLSCEVPVTFPLLALGGSIDVPTVEDCYPLEIPEGTQSGTVFRIRGLGMPIVNGRGRGDLHVAVLVSVPRKLNKEQRNLLEKPREKLPPEKPVPAALQTLPCPGKRVTDIGTGSGVLAMAAAYLGAARVVAIDDDPDAIESPRENVVLNRLDGLVEFTCADFRARPMRVADIVVANLTGALLIQASGRLATTVAPGGHLVVSGFTVAEREAVVADFDSCLPLVEERSEEERGLAVLGGHAQRAGSVAISAGRTTHARAGGGAGAATGGPTGGQPPAPVTAHVAARQTIRPPRPAGSGRFARTGTSSRRAPARRTAAGGRRR